MAASVLPAIGTKYGPCEGTCEHEDCVCTRAMASRLCHFCGHEIGYERRYYRDPDGDDVALVHASCLEDAIVR